MGSGLCTACSKADTTHRQKPVWEREITTREDALKAVQVAACCYFGLSALDCIIASFGEPVLYLTAIVIAVCASLIWACHSRVATITLLCLFIADTIVMAVERFTADQRSAPYVSYALLMLQGGITIQAVKATFKLHKEYRLVPAGVMHSATFASQARVSPAVKQVFPALVDASPPPLSNPTVPASPSLSTPSQNDEPAMPPPLLQKASPLLDEKRSFITPVDKLPSWFTAVGKRLRNRFTVRFNPHRSVDKNPRPIWNPLGIIAWSLIFTPALGSALIYSNWRNLGRSQRAHTAALWFWGSVAWLLFCVSVPPTVRPPLWGYLVFVGLWIGLLAYPHHLSLAKKHPALPQLTSAWAGALALAVSGGLLLWLVHAPFAYLYRQKDAGVVLAPTTENATPVDPANHLFSAEEITQYYRPRVLEIGVRWKVSHGMWFWKSEDEQGSAGSGLMLVNSKDLGLIVTNWHVVNCPDEIVENSYRCGVRQDPSQEFNGASCVARAKPPLDLALLLVKLDGNWHPDVVPIQPVANLHQGENVVAIGNALGEGISTTSGVLSHLDPMGADCLYFIRTSTPISPGNSGGPLFTSRGGFYAGVTTASSSAEHAQNYNVAVPAEYTLDPDNWNFFGEESGPVAKQLLEAARTHKQP